MQTGDLIKPSEGQLGRLAQGIGKIVGQDTRRTQNNAVRGRNAGGKVVDPGDLVKAAKGPNIASVGSNDLGEEIRDAENIGGGKRPARRDDRIRVTVKCEDKLIGAR